MISFAPFAAAGTPDAPEVVDAADDCAFAPGNHYADVTAAWISDETPTDFKVNLQLSKWTLDPLGAAAGYTLQFTHQGVEFGVLAFYGGAALGGWSFSNGHVDLETGELSNVTEAEGSFTAGTPALLTIAFSKSLFPHADAADDKLVGFRGGTVDLKPPLPVWIAEGASGQDAPVEPAPLVCDAVESDATYTFTTGGHSTHGGALDEPAPAANATSEPEAAPLDQTVDDAPGETENDTPGPGIALVLAACGLALLAARRRR